MNIRNIFSSLIATLLLCSFQMGAFEQTNHGVVIPVSYRISGGPSLVRIQVMGENLIHVSATPDRQFNDRPSLIVLNSLAHTPSHVCQNEDTVIVSTSHVKVYVLTSTGEVWFTDNHGKTILREKSGGGKTFQPITVDGTHGYTIRQIFESLDDESFFGLGQHQSDEFNYKGKNEQLFQYNTKVSIPFVVSNKNYGFLLDSYSLCRFGSPVDYSQLNHLFKLYDKNSEEGALTGTYISATGETILRQEDSIYFEDLKTIKNLPQNFSLKGAKIVYEGDLEPLVSGEFKFILYSAGYIKVYIDNRLVVPERWRTAWNPNSYKFAVDLAVGKRVPIRIEWLPDGTSSYCGLRALAPVTFEEQNRQSWWSEMTQQLDYYFIAGENMDEVISGYRTLTGKAPIMPKWAMGFWQSRERYKTSSEIVSVLKEFRDRKIPIDNIVLDWNYWPETQWGSHDFDKSRFPDPKAMVDSIHALKGHMMISVWPKFYVGIEHYKEFDRNGWMYQQSVKDGLVDWIGQGYHYSFYDAYSAGARKLFWKQMYDKLYPLGIDAWWMDASEPNVRDCTDMDYRKALCGPTALGSSTEYFNAYALMNAEAIYDGQRGVDNNKRVFLLTRSGYAGLQRYSTATWSGDIATRWEDMKAQISAGLNFAVSGIPYWTMDIGGFCVEDPYVAAQLEWDKKKVENADLKEWRELNTRWYQFGAFVPLYRAHGQFPFREIWNIAPETHPAYKSIAYYMRLRYRLMPYIYSLAGRVYFKDYTIMRPLVMDFENDETVRNIGDQFMFGSALMVSPVYKFGARTREVYFPKAVGWYDFYTGQFRSGGEKAIVEAPYERIPLYVRAGSIIPVGPEIQYVDEKQADNIRLYIYRGDSAVFTLYEDENVNYNYEKGKYSTISFMYNDSTNTLTIGARKGSFAGMLKARIFTIITVDSKNPRPFDADASGKEVKYDGSQVMVTL